MKMMTGSGFSAALIGATVGLALASTAHAAEFTLKFAVGTQNEPMHEYMKRYESCLEPASGGRIDVQLYPGGQLGGVGSMIEGIQLGTIEAIFIAGQHMKGVEKRYGVVDAPGLFHSFEHANASYWDPDFRDRYLMAGRDKGVMGLAIFAYGPTSFQTVRPVTTLDDFRGLKVRILASDVEQKLTSAIGAAGLQVDWPEIIPSMQRGQIDGVHSNIVIANASKFHTVAKHATLTNSSMIPVVPFMSVRFFESLPGDLQEAVLQCGREVERGMTEVAVDFDNNAQRLWQEAGAQIHFLSDEEQKRIDEIAAKVGEEVYSADPDLRELYEALRNAAQAHGS